jgi:hypothetical protein
MRIFSQRFHFQINTTIIPVENLMGGLIICYASFRKVTFPIIPFQSYDLSNGASGQTFNAISHE